MMEYLGKVGPYMQKEILNTAEETGGKGRGKGRRKRRSARRGI